MTTDKVEFTSISIANLVVDYVDTLKGGRTPFVVRNPDDAKGKKWQALSAGPKFPPHAKSLLRDHFRASKDGFWGNDARCSIPTELVSRFESWLYWQLLGRNLRIDWDPFPEFTKRLSTDYWKGAPPLLTSEEANSISLRPIDFARQPQPKPGADRGGRGAKIRFFRRLTMYPSEAVLAKLEASSVFMTATPVMIASTDKGRQQGEAGGLLIANNVGVVGER